MTDIAQIAFRADTRELSKAKATLESLVPSAAKVEKSTDRVTTAVSRAAGGMGLYVDAAGRVRTANGRFASNAEKVAGGLGGVGQAAQGATNELTRFTATANDNVAKSAGAMKANVGNIAAQFQDIGVTAAMGMSPIMIGLQQGTQLAGVFAASGESLGRTLASAFAQVLSPVSMLTIGMVALAAAGMQMVNWTSLAKSSLNFIADILPELANYVAMVGAALGIAFAPAVVSAIWAIAVAITTGAIAAIGLLISTVGIIPLAIGAAIAAVYFFGKEMSKVFGVDIVGYVKFGVNYVIGSFIAAFDDIIFVWQNFGNIFGAAIMSGINLAIKGINFLVKAAVDGINMVIKASNAIAGLAGMEGFDELTFTPMVEFANIAADALSGAVGDRAKKLKDTMSKDYIGAMGGAITSAAEFASDKLKKFSAGLGAEDDKKKKKSGTKEKSDNEKFGDLVSGALRSIDTMQAERDAIGLTAEAAAKLRFEQEMLNEAQQKNIALTPTMRAAIGDLAAEMANLEVGTAKAKEAIDFAKGLFKGFVQDVKSGLEQGKSLWEAFGDAALNVLNKIVDRLLNEVIDALFQVIEAGGGGGWLGSIAQALFSAQGNVFNDNKPQAFASGGAFSNKVVNKPTAFSMGVMGEAGPEAIMPLTRGPDGKLGVANHGDGGGTGGGNQVLIQVVNNASGTSVREEREKDGNGIDVVRLIIDTVKDATVKGNMDGANKQRYNVAPAKIIR